LNAMWGVLLGRRYLLTTIDRMSLSPVWIDVCSVLVAGAVLAFPNRFGDTIDHASHPALTHPPTVRCHRAAGYLAVDPRATTARIHHVIEPTLEGEAHAAERLVKGATPMLVV